MNRRNAKIWRQYWRIFIRTLSHILAYPKTKEEERPLGLINSLKGTLKLTIVFSNVSIYVIIVPELRDMGPYQFFP